MMEKLGGFLAEINAAYVYIFIAIIAVYLIIRPVTRWAVTTKTTKFLNYMVSSLVMLVLILSGIVLTTVFDKVLLSAVMHCLAFFGVILAIAHVLQQILRNKKKRV